MTLVPRPSAAQEALREAAVAAGCRPIWADGILGWAYHCGCPGIPHDARIPFGRSRPDDQARQPQGAPGREGACPEAPMTAPDVVVIGREHPLWAAWDDDDWDGATASRWMHDHIRPGILVRLHPPGTPQLTERVAAAMRRMGATVEIAARL